ncbi:hypothetical protein ES708_26369 [subsurface metagenome]
MHTIQLAVSIGIKFRLDPEVMTNPHIGIFKCGDDLRFAIDNDWSRWLFIRAIYLLNLSARLNGEYYCNRRYGNY